MKLDFNKALVDLDGKEIENTNLGKVLAQQLVQTNKGDALKFWEIALKLQKCEVIDLDTSDQTLIKDFIKATDTLSNMGKAQILLVFDTSKK